MKNTLKEPEIQQEIGLEKRELAVLCKEKARQCVIAIDDEKIQKSSALQLATAGGILFDKSLLLAGEPTSIDVHMLVDAAKAYRDMRRAERLKELSAPPVIEAAPPTKDSRQLASQDEPTARYLHAKETMPETDPMAYGLKTGNQR